MINAVGVSIKCLRLLGASDPTAYRRDPRCFGSSWPTAFRSGVEKGGNRFVFFVVMGALEVEVCKVEKRGDKSDECGVHETAFNGKSVLGGGG